MPTTSAAATISTSIPTASGRERAARRAPARIFRHLPVKVPLAHFRPGVNRITIRRCADARRGRALPGFSGGGQPFRPLRHQRLPHARHGRVSLAGPRRLRRRRHGGSGTPVQIVVARAGPGLCAAANVVPSSPSRPDAWCRRREPAPARRRPAIHRRPRQFSPRRSPPSTSTSAPAPPGPAGGADLSSLSVNVDAAALRGPSAGAAPPPRLRPLAAGAHQASRTWLSLTLARAHLRPLPLLPVRPAPRPRLRPAAASVL